MLLIFQPLGTAPNSAIQKYMNAKKVPQLFVATGATKWGDPKNFPWTMGFQPNYQSEGRIYAKYILENKPAGKIGVLFQNDDYGKDVLKGLKDGLGAKASMVIAEVPYETADPTVDSQIVRLKASGADVFVNITTPKFAAQAIKKVARARLEAAAHPQQRGRLDRRDACVRRGSRISKGILTTSLFARTRPIPPNAKDPGVVEWTAFMDKYYPEGDKNNSSNVSGYVTARAAGRRCSSSAATTSRART